MTQKTEIITTLSTPQPAPEIPKPTVGEGDKVGEAAAWIIHHVPGAMEPYQELELRWQNHWRAIMQEAKSMKPDAELKVDESPISSPTGIASKNKFAETLASNARDMRPAELVITELVVKAVKRSEIIKIFGADGSANKVRKITNAISDIAENEAKRKVVKEFGEISFGADEKSQSAHASPSSGTVAGGGFVNMVSASGVSGGMARGAAEPDRPARLARKTNHHRKGFESDPATSASPSVPPAES